jgi:hypothetical protein
MRSNAIQVLKTKLTTAGLKKHNDQRHRGLNSRAAPSRDTPTPLGQLHLLDHMRYNESADGEHDTNPPRLACVSYKCVLGFLTARSCQLLCSIRYLDVFTNISGCHGTYGVTTKSFPCQLCLKVQQVSSLTELIVAMTLFYTSTCDTGC